METWSLYDQYRHKTKETMIRGNEVPSGLYHLVVHIWIVNDKSEFLIQQRSPHKGYPNMWDTAAAGSVILNESSIGAAMRETKEEIGVTFTPQQASLFGVIKFSVGFDDYWLVKMNVDINDIKMQEEEVVAVKWATKEEIMSLWKNNAFVPYTFLDIIFQIATSPIQLFLAIPQDAICLYDLQKEVFLPLYEKYHDDISPVLQPYDRFLRRFTFGDYYKINFNNQLVGSVFVYEKDPGQMVFHIINIKDAFQNNGIGQEVMRRLELIYPQADSWELETIKQETRNCHFYEKMGYSLVSEERIINDKMTIIKYYKTNIFRITPHK